MKRRLALQNIAMLSSGVILLPSCELFRNDIPVYSNIPLEKSQYRLIAKLTETILPKENLEIITPEPTVDFVLTMVNDCYSPEDIEIFISGLNEFELYLDENYKRRFWRMEPQNQLEILEYMENSVSLSDELNFFYSTTKALTIQHFTTSDFFMTNYLDYEMIPGRYLGCIPV